MAELPRHLLGYLLRAGLGIGLALVLAATGAVLARMGLLVFGLTSWTSWIIMLVTGAGLGAGLGSGVAWLWLKGIGQGATAAIFVGTLAAGVAGSWLAYGYGAGVEPECCASPQMGPIAYAVIGAVTGANLAAAVAGVTGQSLYFLLRNRRHASAAS